MSSNVEAEGIDMGPSPTDAALAADLALPDRGPRPHGPVPQLPQARGASLRGRLISRSEADLLDIRNFGAKSIDEVKAKARRDGSGPEGQPAGFDPHTLVGGYAEDYDDDSSLRRGRAALTTRR